MSKIGNIIFKFKTHLLFRPCIESYRVRLCDANTEVDNICFEKQLFPVQDLVDDLMPNLKMCSFYLLEVFPLYGNSEVRTKTTKFKTQGGLSIKFFFGFILHFVFGPRIYKREEV